MGTRRTKSKAQPSGDDEQIIFCLKPRFSNRTLSQILGASSAEEYIEKTKDIANRAIRDNELGFRKTEWIEHAQKVGQDLFKFAIGRQKASLLEDLRNAREKHKPLRIILDLQEPEISNFAWELLAWDNNNDECLTLSDETLVMRSTRPLASSWNVVEPIRLLIASASPPGLNAPNIDHEIYRIQQILNPLGKNRVNIAELRNTGINSLGEKLRQFDPHVIHFIAHGQPDGLELVGANSRKQLVSPQQLASQILRQAPSLNLFVTTACESAVAHFGKFSVAHHLSMEGVPVVIGMQFELSENAVTEFVTCLYESLKSSDNIAQGLARTRISLKETFPFSSDWASPVSYVTHNQNDILFRPTDVLVVSKLREECEKIKNIYEYLKGFKTLPQDKFINGVIDSINSISWCTEQLQSISYLRLEFQIEEAIGEIDQLVAPVRSDSRYIVQFVTGDRKEPVDREFFKIVEEYTKNIAKLINALNRLLQHFLG